MTNPTYETWKTPTGTIADAPEWAVAIFAGIDFRHANRINTEALVITIHAIGPNRRRAVLDYIVVDRTAVEDVDGRTFFVLVSAFSSASKEQVWKALGRKFMTADGRELELRLAFLSGASWLAVQEFALEPTSQRIGIVPVRGSVVPDGVLNRSGRSPSRTGEAHIVGMAAAGAQLTHALPLPAGDPGSYVVTDRLAGWLPPTDEGFREALALGYAAERYAVSQQPQLRREVDEISFFRFPIDPSVPQNPFASYTDEQLKLAVHQLSSEQLNRMLVRHSEGDPDAIWNDRLRSLGTSRPSRRHVDVTEDRIRNLCLTSIVERQLKCAPGWRIAKDGVEAFVGVEEGVKMSTWDLSTIIAGRLAEARVAGTAA